MKSTKELNTNKGITLIALVVTIIVMLLLVGVTISTVVDGGLFEQAGKAASETNEALKAEEELSKGKIQIGDEVYNSIEEYVNKYKGDNVEKISKETSYVGCYADVDGNGSVDGVIYADLAKGGRGSYYECEYSYEAETAEELKDYYVNGTHNGAFGNGIEVLTATGTGKDRFYVMALSDISTSDYYWYQGLNCCDFKTPDDFGTGKSNTKTIIEEWDKSTYGTKNEENDIWGYIKTQVGKGWFVPSVGEWVAFAERFASISGNGLEYAYWTSSLEDAEDMSYVWHIEFDTESISTNTADSTYRVRLSTTF